VVAGEVDRAYDPCLQRHACGQFGVCASAQRKRWFETEDLDETLPGAWQWDPWRSAFGAAAADRALGSDELAPCGDATHEIRHP